LQRRGRRRNKIKTIIIKRIRRIAGNKEEDKKSKGRRRWR
jgi:hypothetical protein